MNERIKKIRKRLELSQEEFGGKIKITRSSVSKLEKGENNPSDQTIALICKEFGVNEVWLRTGEGGPENMFAKVDPEDKYSISLGKITMSQNKFVQNAVNYLADAEPEKLKVLEEFMKGCLGID